jgi:hypothetical protein
MYIVRFQLTALSFSEWVSPDLSTDVTWDPKPLNDMTYLRFNPPGSMNDNTDSAEDATAVYAMSKVS